MESPAQVTGVKTAAASPGEEQRRRTWLTELRRMLPYSAPWHDWLARTGELPPDFARLPASPDLPDVLPDSVSDPDSWALHRDVLKEQFTHWFLGTCPPPPDILQSETLAEHKENGVAVRSLRLRFGEHHKASLTVELLIPPGPGPFPVLLTQQNHRDWALIAARRGYIGCVYAGADLRDDTDSFLEPYPGYDWSRLMRRAWAASRCVDYLINLPEVNPDQIAITGHSRNGKASLMAAAFDERIGAVIASSPGAGGSLSARSCSEQQFGEGIELLTRNFPEWFHPRLRFFVGNEQFLPVDMHQLVALSGPRPCLLSTAMYDSCENSWAAQESYLVAQRVYDFLGAPEALCIQWRPGGHGTSPTTIERYLDWCDTHFDRDTYDFPERLLHPYDWEAWRQRNEPSDTPIVRNDDTAALRQAIQAIIGSEPPGARNSPGAYGAEPASTATALGRADAGEGVEKQQIVFGEYITADLYSPAGLAESGDAAPTVLWLHPWPSAHGYRAAYGRGEQVYRSIARVGFVVCCFDHIGSGSRVEEAEHFYQRHPNWSLLGKMTRDARAALDLLQTLPFIQADRVFGVGYSVGSLIGLHLGAMDERLAGLAVVSPPSVLRPGPASNGTDRSQHWSYRDLLAPQLGFYAGQEGRIPYDIPHLMSSLAPRPLLVVSPQHDRDAPLETITAAMTMARGSYLERDAGEHLEQIVPATYNQFGPDMHDLVIKWLQKYVSR